MDKGEPLQPFEFSFPGPLSDGDVEIDVLYCGLCHSDIAVINDEWGMWPEYPIVPGHEVIGNIVAVGSEVTKLKIGQRVGLGWNSGYCGDCAGCARGLQNTCRGAKVTILNQTGGFAERVRSQAKAVFPIPDELPSRVAGPLLCGGATVFAPLIQHSIKPTDSVAVLGCGGLGHLAIQYLKHWGCRVTAFSSCDNKRDELLALGATEVCSSTDLKSISMMQDRFDFILVTMYGEQINWDPYINMLAPNGRIHFVGIFTELKFVLETILGSQRSVSASPTASPAVITMALQFAARHNIVPEIEEFALSDINEAIKKTTEKTIRYRAVLKVKP